VEPVCQVDADNADRAGGLLTHLLAPHLMDTAGRGTSPHTRGIVVAAEVRAAFSRRAERSLRVEMP
jgi:hypothetical protein